MGLGRSRVGLNHLAKPWPEVEVSTKKVIESILGSMLRWLRHLLSHMYSSYFYSSVCCFHTSLFQVGDNSTTQRGGIAG